MYNLFISTPEYLLTAGASTLLHLIILFGPLLLLALMMNYISRVNEKLSYRIFGMKNYLILFGWLGTSAHELGHALFALLFGHRITKIRLFKPDYETGTLGYVNHTYNPGNLYHQTGNFLIGIGPILLGILTLGLLSFLLFGINLFNNDTISFSFATLKSASLLNTEAHNFWRILSSFLNDVFNGEKTTWWKVAIFIYCLYTIGNSITLSRSDLATARKGFLIIVALIFIFNLATVWTGDFAMGLTTKLTSFFSGFYTIMLLSMVVNLGFLLSFSGVWVIKQLLRKQQ